MVIEYSLPPTRQTAPAPSRYGGAAREGGAQVHGTGRGGGWVFSDGGNSGYDNGDVTGGRKGGASGHLGEINVETTAALE